MKNYVVLVGLLVCLSCQKEEPATPAASPESPATTAAAAAAAVVPLSAPAREVGDAVAPYPALAGQIVDHAIYKGTYKALETLTLRLSGGDAKSPAAGKQDRPRGKMLTVWHTGNVHGEREDCGCPKRPLGGLGRKATLIAEAAAKEDRADGSMIVDAGNLLFKSARGRRANKRAVEIVEAEAVVEAFNSIGCHGFAVGEFDMAMGLETLQALHKKSRFPWLSANLRGTDGALLFKPFFMTEEAGLKIALVGLTFHRAQDAEANKALGFVVEEPLAALKAQSAAIKAARPDVVMLLSNLGIRKTEETLAALASSDAAFPVHMASVSGTGRMTFEPVWAGETFMVESGSRGKYLGRVDLHVVGDSVAFRPEKNPQGKAVLDYLNSYRSLHNARRTLHRDGLPDGAVPGKEAKGAADKKAITAKRLKRNLDYAVMRLKKVEAGLPAQLALNTAKPTATESWLKVELLPVDKKIAQVPKVRRLLDKYIDKAKKAKRK